MKILIDKMPTKVDDCPWSCPTENPWNAYTTWFCQYSLSNGETCPMVKGGECPPYFITMSRQSDLDCIVNAFNAAPGGYPFCTQEVKEFIIRNPNRKD